MPSLIEKWHPVTHDFGLIRAPLKDVVAAYLGWHQTLGLEYSRSNISSSLSDAFVSLLPLANSKMRGLFVATRSDWTAYFQNGIQGSDPGPPMTQLALKLNTLAMRVCSTPDTAKYSGTAWEVFAHESLGGDPISGCRRSIAVANDGGRWIFEESGERFPFEQVDHYIAPKKRDRLTREMLASYLWTFGIEAFSDEFFRVDATTPAVRLQRRTKVWSTPEFTLDEVAAGLPWQKTH